ncbi:hypothetical protein COU77_01350 [Candidatus Peregrinibacteria bacterium CG10_big_fil_rev_8_21_14_0_10_49_16]|nr:MAG: hypothetical protein COW95_01280 [Candidatus Peregrinibacteria bacterium CG22_combo_CG10-13_8_21_14_all_49_11]PIR52256.1 MAG: hypothetical protein COU77_01350 [Candidatus Peregrinibacteria bacterium CG10_big_fil_rev_8_21_14_0_10_49_16]
MSDNQQLSSATLELLEQAEQYKFLGKHKEALALLEELLLEDPSNVPALEEVADNELSLEQLKRAETAAKRAISLNKESFAGQYVLGCIAMRSKEWKRAVEHLRLANSLHPNDPEILRCLGWTLFFSGKRLQGVVTLERALNLDEENPWILCDLADVYIRVGCRAKAESLLQRAEEFGEDNERILLLRKKLQSVSH